MKFFRNFFAIIGFLVLVTLVLVFVASVASVVTLATKGIGEEGLQSIKTEHAVAVVKLEGELMESQEFRKHLKKQLSNERVKAVVVRIDSPGGSVAAAEELFQIIKKGAEAKPIVCSLGNIAASGGLFAAMGCQKVVSNMGTLTGSIGVIMMMPNLQSASDKLGVRFNVIKSGEFKDAGSPFRDITADDRKLLQGIVDKAHLQFVSIIAKARKLDLDKVKTFADGRIILGEDAVKLGIVDELGGIERAAKLALELTGDENEPEIVFPSQRTGFWALMDDMNEAIAPTWLKSLKGPKLMYLSGLSGWNYR